MSRAAELIEKCHLSDTFPEDLVGQSSEPTELTEKCHLSNTSGAGQHWSALPENGITNVQMMLAGRIEPFVFVQGRSRTFAGLRDGSC